MYGFTTTLSGVAFEAALARTIEALKAEGFGILSDIDVQAAMKTKLGVDMPPYRILGACNPPPAHQAVTAVPDIGLLLPCNVVVRATDEGTVVDMINPQMMVELTSSDEMAAVADEVDKSLSAALASISS